MIPDSYSGLSVVHESYAEEDAADAELIKNIREEADVSGWEARPFDEYIAQHENRQRIYYPITVEMERDMRPVPTATFLKRMGLEDEITYVEDGEMQQYLLTSGVEIWFRNASELSNNSYKDNTTSGTEQNVLIEEYSSDEFSNRAIKDIMEQFWEAAVKEDPELTKEQWLEDQSVNKLVRFHLKNKYRVAQAVNNFLNSHPGQYWWSVYNRYPLLVDSHTGKMYVPQSIDSVSKLSLQTLNDDIHLLFKYEVEWQRNSQYGFNDFVETSAIYALVPGDYDGLAFGTETYQMGRTDDQIRDIIKGEQNKKTDTKEEAEEAASWWEGHYYTYNEYHYLTTQLYALKK